VSDPQQPYGRQYPTQRQGQVPEGERPPGVVPPPGQPAWQPAEEPPERPRLDAGRYWAGAAATVLVCALLGFAASVVFDEVFDIGLYPPPDAAGVGDDASWAAAGAIFALAAAVVLHLLVVIAPRPRMFFGWLVGLTTVILAVLPFAGNPDLLRGAMTALVWVILGLAVSSMLGAVLGRTLADPLRTT
jgi:hypothetical protein